MPPEPTTTTTDDGDDEYTWLIPGYRLRVEAGVGNGYGAQIRVSLNGKTWGPTANRLVVDTEPTDGLSGKLLSVVADVRPGSQATPRPALLTLIVSQFDPAKPAEQEDEHRYELTRSLDGATVARFDFAIGLW
jgi:hypothetical protein